MPKKLTCPRGHPKDGTRTAKVKRGGRVLVYEQRYCLVCNRAWSRADHTKYVHVRVDKALYLDVLREAREHGRRLYLEAGLLLTEALRARAKKQ